MTAFRFSGLDLDREPKLVWGSPSQGGFQGETGRAGGTCVALQWA